MDLRLLPELLGRGARAGTLRGIAVSAAVLLALTACTADEPSSADGPDGITSGQPDVTSGPTGETGSEVPVALGPRQAVAVWPEDTAADLVAAADGVAAGADPWRLDPALTAAAFADLVLAWPDPSLGDPEADGFTTRIQVEREPGGPEVVVTLSQVVEPIWSVIAVADAVDPLYPPFVITEGEAEIQVGLPEGTTAIVTLGYGLRTSTRSLGSPGTLSVDLGTTPTTGGHLLILYVDADNRVVSASGTPIAAGDTAAG
jgi:hypothetical protein